MERQIVVIGLGMSGQGAAEFLLKQGKKVLGVDKRAFELQREGKLDGLLRLGLVIQGEEKKIDFATVEEVIVSPGVSPAHPLYKEALARGIPLRGEAELALSHYTAPLVAVTGTNGKTTVVLLVAHVLQVCGIRARALGNVGVSLCHALLDSEREEVAVVELSSYQLETMRTPVFTAAVLLNITPDHLDRYGSMQEYAKAKARLQHLLKGEFPFYVAARVLDEFPDLIEKERVEVFDRGEGIFTPEEIPGGGHERQNAQAAFSLCRPFSISREQFLKAFATFKKPPHRLSFLREVQGVSFYDDSKGTNIDAVIQAVKAMPGEVILIAGGVDKGASYLAWQEAFAGKVKKIVALGAAALKIYHELHPYFKIELVGSLGKAVEVAAAGAKRGDCVLLSPGCSSFDMFRDYAHRGEEFERYVHRLTI